VTLSTQQPTAARPLWDYRPGVAGFGPLEGYAVVAFDGGVGEVVAAEGKAGRSFLVAATGPTLEGGTLTAGRMVMLPGGLIERVDPKARVVHVAATRALIATAPTFEGDRYRDGAYRAELGAHYGPAVGLETAGAGSR
jgi:hypothetical protein